MKIVKLMIMTLLLSIGMTGRGNILFRHIGVESGLSQSTVLAILQDRTGLMWIGTKSGLNRYDGTLSVIPTDIALAVVILMRFSRMPMAGYGWEPIVAYGFITHLPTLSPALISAAPMERVLLTW